MFQHQRMFGGIAVAHRAVVKSVRNFFVFVFVFKGLARDVKLPSVTFSPKAGFDRRQLVRGELSLSFDL